MVFSCQFQKIFKNTFYYRTSPVAASGFSERKNIVALLCSVLKLQFLSTNLGLHHLPSRRTSI